MSVEQWQAEGIFYLVLAGTIWLGIFLTGMFLYALYQTIKEKMNK